MTIVELRCPYCKLMISRTAKHYTKNNLTTQITFLMEDLKDHIINTHVPEILTIRGEKG